VADTWDEAACRARLAAYKANAAARDVLQCAWHAPADLRAALAALDAARAECDRLGQLVCDFRAASLLEVGGGDPAGVTPAHVERHVTELRVECDRLRAKLEEADGVIAAATSAITEQLNRAVALSRECDRLRARLEECRLIGMGESGAVAESLQLRSECDHWQRKWAEGREEVDRLRAVLTRIQGWDCLNPPRQDLLHDLPWLRRLVDEALGAGQGRPDLGGRP
jgi:hypothetical protein